MDKKIQALIRIEKKKVHSQGLQEDKQAWSIMRQSTNILNHLAMFVLFSMVNLNMCWLQFQSSTKYVLNQIAQNKGIENSSKTISYI